MTSYDVKLIRSNRRTISVEIQKDLSIVVRAPHKAKKKDIEDFLRDRSEWIDSHLKLVKQREDQRADIPKLSDEEIDLLANKALSFIPPRVKHFAALMGVQYSKITIRNQRTRWGSCSSKGNLSFNCLLMLCPDDIVDYVIVHELCHRKHMDHSASFWRDVAVFCPDYKEKRKWLRTHGGDIISRIPD